MKPPILSLHLREMCLFVQTVEMPAPSGPDTNPPAAGDVLVAAGLFMSGMAEVPESSLDRPSTMI